MKRYLIIFLCLIGTLGNCQSNGDSLCIVISSVRETLNNATSKNEKSAREIEKLKAEVKALTGQLSEVDKSLPTSIQPRRIEIYDDKVAVEFNLNKKGLIKVKIFRRGETTAYMERTSPYLENTVIDFYPLYPDTEYYIIAYVVDYIGRETKTVATNEMWTSLNNIRTKSRLNQPSIDFSTPNIGSDNILIPVTSSDKLCYNYYYRLYKTVDNTRTPVGENINGQNLQPDRWGRYENTATLTEIKVPNLKEEEEYDFTFTFYDTYGKSITKNKTYKTIKKVEDLNFVGGVNINYNVLKTIISWKTNKKPLDAFINFQTPDGKTHIKTDAKITTDSCYVELDLNKFKELLNLSTDKKATNIPQINVIIKDEKIEKKMGFKITFSIPTENQIKNSIGLDDKEKKEMLKSVEGLKELSSKPEGKGKIKWKDLVEIGLPVILSFL